MDDRCDAVVISPELSWLILSRLLNAVVDVRLRALGPQVSADIGGEESFLVDRILLMKPGCRDAGADCAPVLACLREGARNRNMEGLGHEDRSARTLVPIRKGLLTNLLSNRIQILNAIATLSQSVSGLSNCFELPADGWRLGQIVDQPNLDFLNRAVRERFVHFLPCAPESLRHVLSSLCPKEPVNCLMEAAGLAFRCMGPRHRGFVALGYNDASCVAVDVDEVARLVVRPVS